MEESKITLRMPSELHAKLVEAARNDSPPASLNSEIVRRLTESFTGESELESVVADLRQSRRALEKQATTLVELAEHYFDERNTLAAQMKAMRSRRRAALPTMKVRK